MSGFQSSRYSIAPHGRQSSLSGSGSLGLGSTAPQPALVARINEKKQELENLIALRDLSANLASQMSQIEEKLSTLTDGTEAVAAVLSNWGAILRAISMASSIFNPFTERPETADDGFPKNEDGLPMPQTLVRLPMQDTKDS
ncbi:DASH complex subunit Dad2-domain-containing protein [Lyophyllum atratum]|nr:DASH complex subunit Dad2-domain-containing protein [Lyophyllum atratum]